MWILSMILHMLENLYFVLLLFTAMPVYRSHHCHRCHDFQGFGHHIENLEKVLSIDLVESDTNPDPDLT